MGKQGLSTFAKNLGGVISKNSPTILTGTAVVGFCTTVIFAVKATPKALILIDHQKEVVGGETLKPWEYVKITWKCYIPTAAVGAATIACIIGSNSINQRRTAALATVYGLTEAAFSEYKDKVVEIVGEKKERGVRDAIAKDRIDRDPIGNNEVIITKTGDALCYDVFSSRYFKSDIDKLKKVENVLNKQLLDEMYVSLNDFYHEIGLCGTKMGGDLGWSVTDGLINFYFSSHLASDGTPCLVIDSRQAPRYDYQSR